MQDNSNKNLIKNMNVREKVQTILKLKGLTAVNAAKEIGASHDTIKKIIERNAISNSIKEKFLIKFSVSKKWWETGEGQIFVNNDENIPSLEREKELRANLETFRIALELLNYKVKNMEAEIERLKKNK